MRHTQVTATMPFDQAAEATWDAIVVGAGPAGSFAAGQLARRGARTLLVDRKLFPRPKVCGACLNGHALRVLASAGLGDLVHSLGAMPLRRFQVHSGSRTASLRLPTGAAVSRDRFDTALVQQALAAGAGFLPGVNCKLLPHERPDAPHRDVELTPVGDEPLARTIRGRIVVMATGLGHPAALPEDVFRSRVHPRSRIGVSGVLGEPCGFDPGTIFMAVGRRGYAGLVQIEDGALNVAAALEAAFVRQCGGPGTAVARLLDDTGLPPLSAAGPAVWNGTLPLTRRARPLAAERVFLIGDAAGYAEPFTGEGIGWALTAAAAVVPLACAGIAHWDFRIAKQWARVYGRQIGRRQRVCRWIAAGLRRPRLAMGVLRVLSCSPWVANPLIRRISGAPARLEASCT